MSFRRVGARYWGVLGSSREDYLLVISRGKGNVV